jgi:hypothetical protein
MGLSGVKNENGGKVPAVLVKLVLARLCRRSYSCGAGVGSPAGVSAAAGSASSA